MDIFFGIILLMLYSTINFVHIIYIIILIYFMQNFNLVILYYCWFIFYNFLTFIHLYFNHYLMVLHNVFQYFLSSNIWILIRQLIQINLINPMLFYYHHNQLLLFYINLWHLFLFNCHIFFSISFFYLNNLDPLLFILLY